MRSRLILAAVIGSIAVVVVLFLLLGLDGVGSLMRQAAELREAGDYEKAADLYWQAAMMNPDLPGAAEALFEAGFTYYVVGKPKAVGERKQSELSKAAEQAFTRLIEKYPESSYVKQTRLELRKLYMDSDDYGKAIEQLEAVVGSIKEPRERQSVCLDMATCYERLGRVELAIGRLKDIINLSQAGETFEQAHLILARFYHQAGLHEQAVVLLNQLLHGPISYHTKQASYTRLAGYLLELHRFEEAMAALDQVEVNSSNRAMINDLRDRIRRRSNPGPAR